MPDIPFSIDLAFPTCIPHKYDRHLERRLSSMEGMFLDTQAFKELQSKGDSLMYEVYEIHRPEIPGELLSGISIVHPGKVGNEFFMTKGHFHSVLETAEIYYCLKGEGVMIMENPEGDTSIEPLVPGKILYVPPRWAHRSVCTGRQNDLVTFFIYPGNAGHDYGTIIKRGFRKLIVDSTDGYKSIDNPNWKTG
ncbi:MAG: glucose-6-phosphate isomerase [Leptolinea sp.]|jgi:glucose-6-phosphate isomerase|nr:glucose-6-phosphate isomerase [Leptolinea sp.]